MNRLSQGMMRKWASLGSEFLPFADAATPDLPLSRLLRLSLFQVSVGMALVLLVGTLNRVMIVELNVPASLVGIMVALPLIFAPFRALIGFRSDTHSSALGWRRVPFMYRGTMVQFGGLAIMPFALLVLAHQGNAEHAPAWLGDAAAGLAFLLVGAGLHTVQTVGLALATDQATVESQPNVVGLMYVMLLFGMIASALVFGAMLANFSGGRLVQVIQGAAVATIVLNTVAVWKQESRRTSGARQVAHHPQFREAWDRFCEGGRVVRRLASVGLGTMAFSMEDVLLEPYGGQILHLSVGGTTRLTATLAFGGLFGFGLASRVLSRGFDPFRMATYGALVGLPAFSAVIAAGPMASPALFALGTGLIGFGAGLFGHGTLTATMNNAPKSQTGLALGAWGAVQASAAGLAIALGGILRDVVAHTLPHAGAAMAYDAVYALELFLLVATLMTMFPLLRQAGAHAGAETSGRKDSPHAAPKKRSFAAMSHPTVRLFGTATAAENALKELRRHRFSSSDIFVIHPPAEGAPAEAGLVDSIAQAGISRPQAEKYAVGVGKGGTLVAVHAPFGTAAIAEEVLDYFDPIDSGVQPHGFGEADYESDATPFSRAMGWKVLSDTPDPFSSFLGLKTLSDTRTKDYPATIPVKTLGGSAAPFSRLFGLPVLSGKAAPFSSLFGMGTLSGKAAPFSSLFGLPTLTTKQTVLGDTKLSASATPFSDALHLPVLTKDQS